MASATMVCTSPSVCAVAVLSVATAVAIGCPAGYRLARSSCRQAAGNEREEWVGESWRALRLLRASKWRHLCVSQRTCRVRGVGGDLEEDAHRPL